MAHSIYTQIQNSGDARWPSGIQIDDQKSEEIQQMIERVQVIMTNHSSETSSQITPRTSARDLLSQVQQLLKDLQLEKCKNLFTQLYQRQRELSFDEQIDFSLSILIEANLQKKTSLLAQQEFLFLGGYFKTPRSEVNNSVYLELARYSVLDPKLRQYSKEFLFMGMNCSQESNPPTDLALLLAAFVHQIPPITPENLVEQLNRLGDYTNLSPLTQELVLRTKTALLFYQFRQSLSVEKLRPAVDSLITAYQKLPNTGVGNESIALLNWMVAYCAYFEEKFAGAYYYALQGREANPQNEKLLYGLCRIEMLSQMKLNLKQAADNLQKFIIQHECRNIPLFMDMVVMPCLDQLVSRDQYARVLPICELLFTQLRAKNDPLLKEVIQQLARYEFVSKKGLQNSTSF